MKSGQRVGEYILEESVGQTTHSEVWRAHNHLWADQLAAVKIPTDPGYLAKLQGVGVKIQRLVHPNIVQPLGFDPKANPPYLITEFVAGGNLRPWLAMKRLTIPQSINIFRQVLTALQFGHEQGAIHADIRPENILLAPNAPATDFAGAGVVKLSEFGVGVAAMSAAIAGSPKLSELLVYIPSEQRAGAPPDVKGDIYSAGVVLFEILTGELPSGADMPSDLNPEVPANLNEIFRKCYARRERRFESVKIILDALGGPAKSAFTSTPTPQAKPSGPAMAIKPPVDIGFADDNADIALKPDASAPPEDDLLPLADEALPSGRDPTEEEPMAVADLESAEIEPPLEDPTPPPPAPSASRAGQPSPGASRAGQASPNASRAGLSSSGSSRMGQPSPASSRAGQPAPGDTVVDSPADSRTSSKVSATPPPKTPAYPVFPPIPRTPSRADTDAMFDELTKKQVRGGDDVRGVFKIFFESRELDEGEAVNIRVRVVKWASTTAGQSDLDQHIILSGATERPLYAIGLIVRSNRGDEPPRGAIVDHPAAEQTRKNLTSNDYRLIAHLSGETIPERLIETIANVPLRATILKLVRHARREFLGRTVRMDLFVFRANLIAVSYRFENQKLRAYLAGSGLTVFGETEVFDRIRQEPTKRAAALLDTEQVQLGLKELRRALDTQQWRAKSEVILGAFRGKLAAAYVAMAGDEFKSLGWLESLNISAKALQLIPGHDGAMTHVRRVRRRTAQLEVLPGIFVSLVFFGLAFLLAWNPQLQFGVYIQNVLTTTLFAAGVGSLAAAIISWLVLGTRMARTDLTFYHAATLPTLIGCAIALAPTQFRNPIGDAICGLVVIIIIIADVVAFKYFREHLYRFVDESQIAGDSLNMLDRIERMVKADWEQIKKYYLELPVLYTFTGAATKAAMPDVVVETAPAEAKAPAAKKPVESPAASKSAKAPKATGDANLDKLVEQMNSRLSTAKRNLAGPAKVMLALIDEYSKSVANHQLGMMQGHANKLEEKAKDLAAKLADFDRLCHSPLAVGDADSPEIQEISAQFAAMPEQPDIVLLKTFVEKAADFRQNQAEAIDELNELSPQVKAAVERFK
ncbi:MAG: protein kinase [Tepidisphaeraceae bacterium]